MHNIQIPVKATRGSRWQQSNQQLRRIKSTTLDAVAYQFRSKVYNDQQKKSEVRASSLASLVLNGISVPRLIQGVSQQIFQQTTKQDKARLSRRMAHTAKKKERVYQYSTKAARRHRGIYDSISPYRVGLAAKRRGSSGISKVAEGCANTKPSWLVFLSSSRRSQRGGG
jgi:hypothetical protein